MATLATNLHLAFWPTINDFGQDSGQLLRTEHALAEQRCRESAAKAGEVLQESVISGMLLAQLLVLFSFAGRLYGTWRPQENASRLQKFSRGGPMAKAAACGSLCLVQHACLIDPALPYQLCTWHDRPAGHNSVCSLVDGSNEKHAHLGCQGPGT